jgi:hypothetical protein
VTKARACKGVRVIFHAPENARELKEWTPTLPNEFPLWEWESQWISKFSKGNFRGQKSLDWEVFYIIENILERRYVKWSCMTHLGT